MKRLDEKTLRDGVEESQKSSEAEAHQDAATEERNDVTKAETDVAITGEGLSPTQQPGLSIYRIHANPICQ